MQGEKVVGTIVKKYSSYYYVQVNESRIYQCQLRGKIKDLAVTGDRAEITILDENRGVLETILPRTNQLYRPRIANVSLLIIVMAYDKPAPVPFLLDRLLLLAYHNRLEPCIIMNKADLNPNPMALKIIDYYSRQGFKLITTCSLTSLGMEELTQFMADHISVLSGPSGVGKSTLINKLIPQQEDIKTQEVSAKIGRGKHTTRHVELFRLPKGGWIADSPGFSNVDLPDIKNRQLPSYYPDFLYYAENCQFADCFHDQEVNCGVKEAFNSGDIADFRYNNYLSFLHEIKNKEINTR